MLSKFSVKKPYTVVVGVVLIIILGVVSFTKMTVDLLPSMNLPYAIVMTTYPGASPEEVEEIVTKPVEQTMATVSNIKDIMSVSSENASTVVMEFEQTSNMDSVTIEMRESLDQIKGFWPDEVTNPMIIKLNPDMMPVLVAAVSAKGDSTSQVSKTIEDKVVQVKTNKEWRLEYMTLLMREEEIWEEGREEGIKGTVSVLKELNIPLQTILVKIQEQYNLSSEEAEKYL